MKKMVIIIGILAVVIIGLLVSIYFIDSNLKIESIKLGDVDYKSNKFSIIITKKKPIIFNHKFQCTAIEDDNVIAASGKKNNCKLVIPMNSNYKIQLKNKFHKTPIYDLEKYIDNENTFKFNKELIYLAINEESELNYNSVNLIKTDKKIDFKTSDETLVKVENEKIIGLAPGEAIISVDGSDSKLRVIVTDLITEPTVRESRKPVVPCNRYSAEENALMDEILKNDVNEAGRGTRAGAVAAARFLTLKFPYRIPYFYENGRLDKGGVNVVDGEGRYYHEGLYLSSQKMDNISPNFSGPAIWGCPLRNWEEDKYFGYYPGSLVPNGLDCSGFVAWTLVNGGFDPGDIGAGETPDAYQMTDLGKFVKLDMDVINSGVIKVGDLFNYWGHISIIIGFDGTYYYVAESLPNFGGVDVRIYDAAGAVDMFRYVVLMDDFYKEDGNYTLFWQ